jgi:type VI secretion system secreted protein VgrG
MDLGLPNLSLPIGLPAPGGVNDPFEFSAGPFPTRHFRVVSFRGYEAMSSPFQYEVELLAPLDEMALLSMPLAVLRKPGYLHIRGAQGNAPRLVHGIISSFSIASADRDARSVRIHATLVPKIWEMGQFVTSRIFQNVTVDEIVTTILDEWGIKHEWRLSNDLPNRTYATQYRESDLQFIARLLAEEGVFYFFEHPSPLLFAAGAGTVGQVGAMANTLSSLPIPGGEIAKDVAGGVEFALMETLILCDDASMYPAIAAADAAGLVSAVANSAISAGQTLGLPTSPIAGLVASSVSPTLEIAWGSDRADNEDHVTAFSQSHNARPEAVAMGDYDFRTPLVPLRADADTRPTPDSAATGGVLAPGIALASKALSGGGPSWSAVTGAAMAGLPAEVPTTLTPWDYRVYLHDDRGEDEADPSNQEVDFARAKMVLEQLRTGSLVCDGVSFCRRLEVGHRFTLAKHPLFFLNIQYVVTAMRCQGDNHDLFATTAADGRAPFHAPYRCEFSCVPSTIRFRPSVPNREHRQVLETAEVVGPGGQEIYVDHHGRIKVQFHWDEDGLRNGQSSCWLRTTQSWSGSGFGSQFIPRIGMEVLVSFLNGNPDRPLVVGCLPNGNNALPFSLPGSATRSGWHTRSTRNSPDSPNGAGGNELSFEDQENFEQIQLRAQRNFDEVVGYDHTLSVVNNDTTIVDGVRTEIVGQHHQTVYGRKVSTVTGDRDDIIGQNHNIKITADRSESVGGFDSREVGNAQSLRVNGSRSLWVDGFLSTLVGTKQTPADAMTSVIGGHTTYATDTVHITSEKKIVLEVGDSRVVIEADKIRIETKALEVVTNEKVTMEAPGSELQIAKDRFDVAAKKVNLYSKGASVELSSNADVNGAKVNLNCGGGSSDLKNADGTPMKLKPLKLTLHDEDMNPFANKKYRLFVAGIKFEGSTDGKGSLTEQVPEEATLGQLTLWIDEYPTGIRINWPIEMIAGPLPDAATVEGALIRLTQLGYYTGEIGALLGDTGEAALRAFQGDYEIPVTGAVDSTTSSKLKEIYGA